MITFSLITRDIDTNELIMLIVHWMNDNGDDNLVEIDYILLYVVCIFTYYLKTFILSLLFNIRGNIIIILIIILI